MTHKLSTSPIKLAEAQALEFYDAYPIHKGKADAIKATVVALRRGDVTFERLMIAVNAYRESDYVQSKLGTDDEHFIPFPATWIRRGRYNDEVSKSKKPNARPHFTREQAVQVWDAIEQFSTAKARCTWQESYDYFLSSMTNDLPLRQHSGDVATSIEFDVFSLDVDASVPSIRVRPYSADKQPSAALAQQAIDALLASWKGDGDA